MLFLNLKLIVFYCRWTADFHGFLKLALTKNPKRRPTAEKLLQVGNLHPYTCVTLRSSWNTALKCSMLILVHNFVLIQHTFVSQNSLGPRLGIELLEKTRNPGQVQAQDDDIDDDPTASAAPKVIHRPSKSAEDRGVKTKSEAMCKHSFQFQAKIPLWTNSIHLHEHYLLYFIYFTPEDPGSGVCDPDVCFLSWANGLLIHFKVYAWILNIQLNSCALLSQRWYLS